LSYFLYFCTFPELKTIHIKQIMKKINIAIVSVLAILPVGCIHDGLPNNNEQGHTITITALLTEETQTRPNTRIAMEEKGLDIDLYWEDGDKIQLGIVYIDTQDRTIKTVQEEAVVVDTENNRKATFNLVIPNDVKEKFDLYGLYGGKGLNTEDPSRANLPDTEDFFAHDLHTLYKKGVVMLYFEALNIDKTTPKFGVNFQHMGSFFKILVKNTGSATINNITEAILEQDGSIGQIAAYPLSNRFSIKDKYFLTGGAESAKTTQVRFPANNAYVVENGVLAFWAWLPMAKGEGEGADWPALRLSIRNGTGSATVTYTDYKAARKATTGKAYHLYATHNGNALAFVGPGVIEIPDGSVDGSGEGILADTRDGNLYATVKIGTQTWMQENLKYLPQVNNLLPLPTSYDEMRYFVYNFHTAPILYQAKETDNYKTYGVLYNWAAAMNGAPSSNTGSGVSSGVQGVCPPGWHIPSYEEWNDLGKYMTAQKWTYDGTGYGPWSRIAKAMATGRPDWNASTVTGAPGNDGDGYDAKVNISKFSALPGGSADGTGNFANDLGKKALFWTSREYNTTLAYRREIKHDSPAVEYEYLSKRGGMSVRCVKD